MSLASNIQKLVQDNQRILIIQADNPDGDSVASSLALEQIIHDLGKEPILYCGVDIPRHLQHLPGWDRVLNEIPKDFDISIIVDCSSRSLLEIADQKSQLSWVMTKPLIILDHHDVKPTIDATISLNQINAVSTGEVIYDLCQELEWPLSEVSRDMIAISILSDSLGLMTEATTPKSIRIIADLVESGVSLPKLEEARRATMRKSAELVRYKGDLLKRIQYHNDTAVATIVIPWDEIEKYSAQYNPSILVLDEMRLTEGAKIAIAFKTYKGNRITAKIRANYGYPIASKLAEYFGGGGHPYASGFKVTGKDPQIVMAECIAKAIKLLEAEINA